MEARFPHTQCWKLNFHDVDYTTVVDVRDGMLTVEVEQDMGHERWSGEFSASYIEDITAKARTVRG